MPEEAIMGFALIAAIAGALAFATLWRRQTTKMRDLRENFTHWRETYPVQQNLLRAGEGIFYIMSLNGGRNWFEFRVHNDKTVEYVGPVGQETLDRLEANRNLAEAAHEAARTGQPIPTSVLGACGYHHRAALDTNYHTLQNLPHSSTWTGDLNSLLAPHGAFSVSKVPVLVFIA